VRCAAAALLLLAACESTPNRLDTGSDVDRYSRLDDPQGSAAYASAMAALARGDRAAALVGLRKTVELCPEHVRAHRLYQDVARELGGEAAAAMMAYYRQLPVPEARAGGSPVPAYLQARLADTSYAQGNALAELLRRHPGFAWGHLSAGRVSRRQGRLLQALDSFSSASTYDPRLPEARLERGQVLAELGRYEESAREYEAYLGLAPDDDASTRAYIDLLIYHLSRLDRALELLRPMLAAAPKDVELNMQMAAIDWLGKRPRQALDGYLEILVDHPTHARALLNIGLLYYEVLPRDAEAQRRLWPQAAIAFQWFLQSDEPQDGHEQFERTVAVPYRLARIAEVLGAAATQAPTGPRSLEVLRWRDS
ncbi:MAG: tetratricopeptide repeat protein, partial [Planctomycetes bacterium]|nr:tetratricopeptide repeat protein [Planctomycetota bacterium]